MARPHPPSPSTIAATNLSRLLSRLSARLNLDLPPTPFELAKLHQNLSHAKSLLAQLDSAPANTAGPFDLRLREDCVRWKGSIRDLEERVWVLEKQSEVEGGEEEEEDEDEEEEVAMVEEKPTLTIPTTTAAAPQQTHPDPAPATTTLRHRFTPRTTTTAAPPSATTSTAILEAHTAEQDSLTSDLLKMAQALKASSLAFGQDLENEKSILESAVSGLDRNVQGMESTGGKMKELQKGQHLGYLKTLINMAICAGLMLAILFVLTLPKLRF